MNIPLYFVRNQSFLSFFYTFIYDKAYIANTIIKFKLLRMLFKLKILWIMKSCLYSFELKI